MGQVGVSGTAVGEGGLVGVTAEGRADLGTAKHTAWAMTARHTDGELGELTDGGSNCTAQHGQELTGKAGLAG